MLNAFGITFTFFSSLLYSSPSLSTLLFLLYNDCILVYNHLNIFSHSPLPFLFGLIPSLHIMSQCIINFTNTKCWSHQKPLLLTLNAVKLIYTILFWASNWVDFHVIFVGLFLLLLLGEFKLFLHHLVHIFAQVINIVDLKWFSLTIDVACGRILLVQLKQQLIGSFHKLFDCVWQLKAILEELLSAEHIQTKTSTRHGNNQTSDISQVSNSLCANQRQQNIYEIWIVSVYVCWRAIHSTLLKRNNH